MTQKFEYAIKVLKIHANRVRALGSLKPPDSEAYKESVKNYQELYEAVKVLEKAGNNE